MADQADLLFGQIAVDRGWIDARTLDRILDEQQALEERGGSLPLGQFLQERGLLDAGQVAEILAEQGFVEIHEEDRRLGSLAVRNRLATREQIAAALDRQKEEFERTGAPPERLGALLVEMGVLTARKLESLVRAQERLRRGGARSTAGAPAVPAAGGLPLPLTVIVPAFAVLCGLCIGIGVWVGSQPDPSAVAPAAGDGELGGIQSALAKPGADLDALRKRLDELRARRDPAGKDAAFDALATALRAAEEESALLAWREFAARVEVHRRAGRFVEACAMLDEHAARHGERDAVRRAAVRKQVLDDARAWFAPYADQARRKGKDGRPEEGIARLGGLRDRLPRDLAPDIDAVVEELRKEAEQLEAEAKSLGAKSGGTPDLPPVTEARRTAAAEAAAKRTAASQARLAEVRRRLAERKQRLAADEKDQAARVVERTTAQPFDVEITADFKLTKCRVAALTRDGITLESRQVTMPMAWESLAPMTAYEIRRQAIDERSAEAQLTLGKFCVLRDLFDLADRHFKRAVELDPALQPRVPATQPFRDRRKLFHGTWSQVGRDFVRLVLDFNKEDELLDLETEAKPSLSKGWLEVAGEGLFLAQVRDLTFSDRVTLEVTGVQEAGAMPFIGLMFESKGGGQAGFFGVASPSQSKLEVARLDERGVTPVFSLPGFTADTPIEMRLADLRLELRAKGKPVWSDAQSEVSECYAVVGGLARTGAGAARFNKVRVEGKAGAEWVRKMLSRNDTLALRELEDDLKGLDTAGATGPRTVALSVEDRLDELPEEVRKRYLWLKTRLDAGDLSDPPALLETLATVAMSAPGFPGVPYYAGRLLSLIGGPLEAIEAYDEALQIEPTFAEALAARAACRLDLSRSDEAKKDAEAALQLAPDLAQAHHLLGRLQFVAGKREEALATLELANALDPGDGEIRLLWKGVKNVLRGPIWAKTFRAETRHVAVRTDVSQARAAFYAAQMEACMVFYAETFGIPLRDRRVDSLVFDTQEGYRTYAELTIEDRVESTLGYYHPLYDQLLLFEDQNEGAGGDTLRVLYHEGFHQFIHPLIPHIPYWLNEGLAEYFGASEVKDGKVVRTGMVQGGRLSGLQAWLNRGGRAFPFDQLMLESPAEFYSGDVPLKYAQAWAMVHFFMQAGATKYRSVLQAYVDALRAGDSAEASFKKTFAKVDLRRAEAEWLTAVRGLKAE